MADFTAFLVAVGPLAVLITKLVDFVRQFDKGNTWWKGTWIALALALGAGYALATGANYVNAIQGLVPGLYTKLSGTGGQVLTGLAIGAMASFWHEPLSGWGSKATTAPDPPMPEPGPAVPEGYDA